MRFRFKETICLNILMLEELMLLKNNIRVLIINHEKDFSNKTYHSNIDQGSIINNCIAEDYPHSAVWGCIITPRCDLAHHGKVSTVHYLPINQYRRLDKK